MLKLGAESKKSPDEVIQRVIKFFGPEGYGLKVTETSDSGVTLEGGGGGVAVSVSREGNTTSVTVSSREWDYQTRQFLRAI